MGTVVRAAMAIEHAGYLENPLHEQALVEAVVDSAIEEGIYVIVDWHDHNAHRHLDASKTFFKAIARKYGSSPNVLFETFNEPEQLSWSGTIKLYHEELISVIRPFSKNLIILGVNTWSQDVDEATRDPAAGENLAYALHFYAGTHKFELREKMERALNKNHCLFVSEWGACECTGDGKLDFRESDTWLSFLEQHQISDCNWAISDKLEAASALKPGSS